ncbi:hypothetical protein SAMN05216266_113136 [Amycolatopsis marina]|uniref:Uncharacterized protein n=1 Tax=Amycolatopsis marina TaxID=490629 RepID=A0A1I1BIV7_9PSEU|nr:hypothetical protein [Amycolatopsis marina]SFB48393.1 hypothetical protein SAMN05216266_113136 [Amycolatopsis marina]
MPVTVTGISSAADLLDETDDYLPLSLRFGPDVQGLYCYFEQRDGGPNAGYIELKVAAGTGEIAAVVVVTRPTVTGTFPEDVPVVEGIVRLELARWAELAEEPDPRTNFVRERSPLSVSTKNGAVYYGLADVVPERIVRSGSAGFGVGPKGELAGVIAGLAESR